MDNWKEKYFAIKDRLSEHVVELQGIKAQYEAAQHRLQLQKRASEEILAKKNALEVENTRLNQYVARVEARLSATAQQTGLAAAVTKQEALRTELNEQKQVVNGLNEEIADLKKELTIVSNALVSREAQLLGSSGESAYVNETMNSRNNNPIGNPALRASLLRSVAALKHDNEALQLQLREEERQRSEAQQNLKVLTKQVSTLTKQNADVLTTNDQLKIDLQHAQDESVVLAKELSDTKEKFTKLSNENSRRGSEIQQLQKVVSGLNQLIQEKTILIDEKESLKKEVDDLKQKLKTSMEQITEYTHLSEILGKRADSAEQLLETRSKELKDVNTKYASVCSATERLNKITVELEENKKELADYKTKLAALEESYRNLSTEHEITTSQKNHLQKMLLATLKNGNRNAENVNQLQAGLNQQTTIENNTNITTQNSLIDSLTTTNNNSSMTFSSLMNSNVTKSSTATNGLDMATAILSKLQKIKSQKEDEIVESVLISGANKNEENKTNTNSVPDILDFSIRGEGNIIDLAGSTQ